MGVIVLPLGFIGVRYNSEYLFMRVFFYSDLLFTIWSLNNYRCHRTAWVNFLNCLYLLIHSILYPHKSVIYVIKRFDRMIKFSIEVFPLITIPSHKLNFFHPTYYDTLESNFKKGAVNSQNFFIDNFLWNGI